MKNNIEQGIAQRVLANDQLFCFAFGKCCSLIKLSLFFMIINMINVKIFSIEYGFGSLYNADKNRKNIANQIGEKDGILKLFIYLSSFGNREKQYIPQKIALQEGLIV